jgi:predicted DNA-binding transcriptional regulator AlpA
MVDRAPTDPVAMLAAMLNGDRWLNAEACAIFVGAVSTRAFLERIACKPGFPKPNRATGRPVWKRSEVDEWMERTRSSRAA